MSLLSVELNNGKTMPMIGLGTWLGEKDKTRIAVEIAIKNGQRHIDCAWIYGNENEIGEGIQNILNSTNIKREELFITTKLWNNFHEPDKVLPAIKKSLELLKLDYVDLYLMHWPVSTKENAKLPPEEDEWLNIPIKDTYLAMEKLVNQGQAKSIGLSNFSMTKIKELLTYCNIKPAVIQIERHPQLQQKELIAQCKDNDIKVTAYSPLGAPKRPARTVNENDPVLLEDGLLNELSKKYNVSTAEILINWSIYSNVIVIPKSITEERIIKNLNIVNISEDDYKKIDSLDRNVRYLAGKAFINPNGNSPYKTYEDLWN